MKRSEVKQLTAVRRGNTIVLVTGILVLLVIIATAYVTRTQAGRTTSAAVQSWSTREDVHQHIAEDIARIIPDALFAAPIDFGASPGWGPVIFPLPSIAASVVNSNRPRLARPADAVRHSRDANFPYNYAPYQVIPWTNWPDELFYPNPGDENLWPKGPGNPSGGGLPGTAIHAYLSGEDNPFGNPGFADSRWARDLEPNRLDTWDISANAPGQDGILDSYSHWRHISNIASADNAWRAIFDISDVGDSNYDGYGRLVTDLNVPIEQWLSVPHNFWNGQTGDTNIYLMGTTPAQAFRNFIDYWGNWMGAANTLSMGGWTPLFGYQSALTNPGITPPNFLRLNDLDADGIPLEAGERPEDEFVGMGMADSQGNIWADGTPRWNVSRILADTDGDGYTDAFWFLAPTSVNSGQRTIVAVSIVDNSGMLNAGVATRFTRNDFDWGSLGIAMKTAGHTPADLALAGQAMSLVNGVNSGFGNYNVGFYDNPEHWYIPTNPPQDPPMVRPGEQSFVTKYHASAWSRHIREIGMFAGTGSGVTDFPTSAMRLDYWRKSASDPLASSVTSRYTPFTLGDEVELRMFAGNNYPWASSRLEWSTEGNESSAVTYFLRSSSGREESSEYLDQLLNRAMVRDSRKRLTVYSAARNDLMPPWLWAFDQIRQPFANLGGNQDLNEDGAIDLIDVNLYNAGMRKFDLRLGPIAEVIGPFFDNDGDLVFDEYGFQPIDSTFNFNLYNRNFSIALRDHLKRSLMDNVYPAGNPGTYYGTDNDGEQQVNHLSAAYAANIAQRRDYDRDGSGDPVNWSPIAQAVPVAPSPTELAPTSAYLGMEPQPFIVEAFIGHVYKAVTVPLSDQDGDPYTDAGDYLLLDYGPTATPPPDRRSTIVVVQIANPYDVPIDLREYSIKVFDQEWRLDPFDPTNPNQPKIRNDVTGIFTPAPYILEPATDDKPTTAIFYSIDPTLIGIDPNDLKWRTFLDLEFGDHPQISGVTNTIIATSETEVWSRDRQWYDDSPTDVQPIELRRLDPGADPLLPNSWVVVDRIDPENDTRFGDLVRLMADPDQRPCLEPSPLNWYDVPPEGAPWEHPTCAVITDVKLGPQSLGYSQWVQWVRATRAWGIDMNANNRYDDSERSPRYVFADRAVITPGGTPVAGEPALNGTTRMRGGNRYKFLDHPNGLTTDPANWPAPGQPVGVTANLPWFTRAYKLPGNRECTDPHVYDPANLSHVFPRKPTFFDMNGVRDPIPACVDTYYPLGFSYPDKGWYSQYGSGNPSVDESPVFADNPNTVPVEAVNTSLNFPMQMLHKDGDFEQVGELLNVWLYGHRIEMPGGVFSGVTERTFSEFMSQHPSANFQDLVGEGAGVNRLRIEPHTAGGGDMGQIVGVGSTTDASDPRHSVPALPAGARLMDAFVCDGPGINIFDNDGDGSLTDNDVELQKFHNAKGFDGSATFGMPNANTAAPEVLRALPNWYRLVHETGRQNPSPQICGGSPALNTEQVMFNFVGQFANQSLVANFNDPDALLPRTMIPEAAVHYREGFNGGYEFGTTTLHPVPAQTGIFEGANYENRREMFTRSTPNDTTKWVRGERGFASIGELLNLNQPGQNSLNGYITRQAPFAGTFDYIFNQYWRTDLGITPVNDSSPDLVTPYPATNDPGYAKPLRNVHQGTNLLYQPSMRVSTDRTNVYDPFNSIIGTDLGNSTVILRPDNTAGDVEEANALFAGASNIITTRSDTFTVYFRVRTFRQNMSINPPRWDATNPEYIIDDARYVMLVDRSNVNKPGDRPRILYLEKLPN